MMKSIEDVEGSSGANEGAEEQKEMPPEEKEQCLSFVMDFQQVGMEEQHCQQEQRTAAGSEPSAPSSVPDLNSLDSEKFFKLVAASQSRRMDDQRVSLSLLPGVEIHSSKGSALMNTGESDKLCNFVIRAQSSRMDDQRCAPPQIILSPGSPVSQRRSSARPASPTQEPDSASRPPQRSASFSPISEKERTQRDNNINAQTLSPGEEEKIFSLVCQALRGRMEDQRCSLDPRMRTPPPQGIIPQGVDPEPFYKLVSKVQSNRLDDQRVALNCLPGIQTPSGDTQTPLTVEETDKFCNIISRAQSKRMDEQRCYAPHIQLGSPAPPRKVGPDLSSPKKDRLGSQSSSKAPRRSSATISSPSEKHLQQNNSYHTAQVPVNIDQEQYFSMVHQAQRWTGDQQQAIDSNALSSEHFFTLVANSQSRRMDDQRTAMPPAQNKKPSIPQIILTPESPVTPRAASFRRTSLNQDRDSLSRPPPRSASFSPVSDKERMQYDSNISRKLTFQVSVCLTPPREGSKSDSQQGSYPEIFLTVGPPGGEAFVLPLTPTVCGPTSLKATPQSRRHHSRSPSPHRAHARTTHSRSSSPNPAPQPCPISTDEDYFTLIQRVHTAQLQQGNTPERRRGKGEGRREKKDRAKRK